MRTLIAALILAGALTSGSSFAYQAYTPSETEPVSVEQTVPADQQALFILCTVMGLCGCSCGGASAMLEHIPADTDRQILLTESGKESQSQTMQLAGWSKKDWWRLIWLI